MEIYAKGQLSFLILNCLLERDFYGLDIISEIKARSNGNIDLKKPSVYSNLTRMEKQGQVSSYMQSSDLGPNRRYYSITEKGRQTYQELKKEFERNHFNVFSDFQPDENQQKYEKKEDSLHQSNQMDDQEDNEGNGDTSDFFDFSSLDDNSTKADVSSFVTQSSEEENLNNDDFENSNTKDNLDETEEREDNVDFEDNKNIVSAEEESPIEDVNQKDEIDMAVSNQQTSVENDSQSNKSDSVYLEPQDRLEVERYNRKLYDISKDMTKYRKKRSFAEDQIAMVASDPLQVSDEKTKQKVEEFKNSLLENKEKYNTRLSEEQFSFRMKKDKAKVFDEEPKTEDDGIFIVDRVDQEALGKAKMIEPPRLKIETSAVAKEQKLPAPKRDVNIDPSHKEIISRIYSKSRANDDETNDYNMLDYDDLTNYYKKQNISFKTYTKATNKTRHNTNKLLLVSSILVFLTMAVFSGAIFGILFAFEKLNGNTNFLYILLPALYLIEVIQKAYNNARYSSWEPAPMKPQWFIWLISLLLCGVVVGLNFLFGMATSNFANYATTIILPIGLILIALPYRYYLKRHMLIKYWR